MHPRKRAGEQQRVSHVVAVAEVSESEPGQRALLFPNRLQVGECLTWVRIVGQRVDDRDVRCGSEVLDPVLPERPNHDHRDVTRQDLCRVLDRLAPTHLSASRVDDDRVAPELRDAGIE